ncbi:hypothetical protein [Methylocaldum gracile]|uniref:hypothetical protein n=1 Tax=Methylocaldum sp. 0917 TaxID=2485163 RepID=UPI0010E2F0B5
MIAATWRERGPSVTGIWPLTKVAVVRMITGNGGIASTRGITGIGSRSRSRRAAVHPHRVEREHDSLGRDQDAEVGDVGRDCADHRQMAGQLGFEELAGGVLVELDAAVEESEVECHGDPAEAG